MSRKVKGYHGTTNARVLMFCLLSLDVVSGRAMESLASSSKGFQKAIDLTSQAYGGILGFRTSAATRPKLILEVMSTRSNQIMSKAPNTPTARDHLTNSSSARGLNTPAKEISPLLPSQNRGRDPSAIPWAHPRLYPALSKGQQRDAPMIKTSNQREPEGATDAAAPPRQQLQQLLGLEDHHKAKYGGDDDEDNAWSKMIKYLSSFREIFVNTRP